MEKCKEIRVVPQFARGSAHSVPKNAGRSESTKPQHFAIVGFVGPARLSDGQLFCACNSILMQY